MDVILCSSTDDYVMDDPNSRRISRAEFSGCFTSCNRKIDPIRHRGRSFMEVSGVLTQDGEGVPTAWIG